MEGGAPRADERGALAAAAASSALVALTAAMFKGGGTTCEAEVFALPRRRDEDGRLPPELPIS